MNRKPCKSDCHGCRDNFYNGENPYGIAECWNLKTATFVKRKLVHVDQMPPWNQEPQTILNCYRPERYIQVAPDQVR